MFVCIFFFLLKRMFIIQFLKKIFENRKKINIFFTKIDLLLFFLFKLLFILKWLLKVVFTIKFYKLF